MIVRRLLAMVLLIGVGSLLSGCMVFAGLIVGNARKAADAGLNDQWVVVTYTGTGAKSPLDAMDSLLDTELAADEALSEAGLGMIDGNEIGDNEYQLFFVGPDRELMWEVLEPILDEAPVEWSRVELFESLDNDPDRVILPR